MKIYRLSQNYRYYQIFQAEPASDTQLVTDCKPLASTWQPPSIRIVNPAKEPGDFFDAFGGSPILSPRASDALQSYLERAGELLPLPHEGRLYYLFNVTECIDCLDAERTEWRLDHGKRIWPTRYEFYPDRLPNLEIFKIPQTRRMEVLVIDREDGMGLAAALREYDLKGYYLTVLWSG